MAIRADAPLSAYVQAYAFLKSFNLEAEYWKSFEDDGVLWHRYKSRRIENA